MSAIQQLLTEHLDIWTAADTGPKSGRGRSSANAAKVYGISKLRELILELAVRGKLVPQDTSDEPASELLKRIKPERAKLTAEGKIKKESTPAAITEEESPFEIPHGWAWVRLPDISVYKVGKTPSTKSSAYWANSGDGFNWVSIADLDHDGRVSETSKQITDKAISEVFRCDPAPAGTILMSFKLTLGKISILDKPAFHNEAIISIYPSGAIVKNFLFKVLPARALAGNSKSAIKGNTLNSESIAALMIPLPPLSEQHRIVAKVDELMALCDQLEAEHNNATEAHDKLVSHLLGTLTQSQSAEDFSANWQRIATHFDTLFTTEASIDALKQTLLQLAVMGKLVPQDPNDEPASELLKRIQIEKVKLIAAGRIKKDKLLEPITDAEKPFHLPHGWQRIKCQDICSKITDGEHATPRRSESGFYLLSARNVTNDGIVLEDVDFVPLDEFERIRSRCDPNIGDILISCSGSVGRVALVDKDNTYSMVRSAAMIRPVPKGLSNAYLTMLLRSPYLQAQMRQRSKQSAQANLFLGAISNLVLVLPPEPEQHRIVAKVDELMAICDQLKSRLTEAGQLQQKLADVLVVNAVSVNGEKH